MIKTITIKQAAKIDFNKPIVSENKGDVYLLLPQLKKNTGYEAFGYNWLNLKTLTWNSCCFFETQEKAVSAYPNCFNADITLD